MSPLLLLSTGVILLISVLISVFIIFGKGKNATFSTTTPKKKVVLLCGSSGSGKSKLFNEICNSNKKICTVTSASINSGRDGEMEIIDIPGSPIIRERLFDERISSAGLIIFFLNKVEDISFLIHVLAMTCSTIKIFIDKEINLEKEFNSFISNLSKNSLSNDHTLTVDTRSSVLSDLLTLCKRYNIPFEEDFIDYAILNDLTLSTITRKDFIILPSHPSKEDIFF